MSELATPLCNVLEATGYLSDGRPAAASVTICNGDDSHGRRSFRPDVQWRSPAAQKSYFKYAENPSNDEIGTWQREVWNEGAVPLLWIVGRDSTDLYNGFGLPQKANNAARNRLDTFRHVESTDGLSSRDKDLGLIELNARAGRLAMETGEFWRQEPRVNRKTTVDRHLLSELAILEKTLLRAELSIDETQGLIGRSIFAKYLVDRQIITKERLRRKCGHGTLQDVLRERSATERLFNWLTNTFNGDMFPSASKTPDIRHLEQVARFLDAEDPHSGQRSLFPYRFDLIPVELLSAIYEQFVHSADAESRDSAAKSAGVYYTPLAAVSLILEEVMQGLTGTETVLDITCGSGVFLVEALRRLVDLKAGAGKPTRKMIRDTLYKQVHGIDISPAAVRIAAFSLYLAALELDPDPRPNRMIRFAPIIGKTLLVGDAHSIEIVPEGAKISAKKTNHEKFDLIVGNPPFTENRDRGEKRKIDAVQPPQDRSLVFAERARYFSHDKTRFGLILRATPFFSRGKGRTAAQNLVQELSPVTLVNLSNCSSWLFDKANVPVIVLLARYRQQQDAKHMMLVQTHRSPSGHQGHTFDIGPGDVAKLHVASWKRNANLFKAAFLGNYHDLLLLDHLFDTQKTLSSRLDEIGTKFSEGLKPGRNGRQDATFLRRLPLLESDDVIPFSLRTPIHEFDAKTAARTRKREIYKAPLLLVHEFVKSTSNGYRPVVTISKEDLVFTNTCYGASFPSDRIEIAHLLAAVLSSAFASWYFIMTGSTFGLWARRLLQADLEAIPIPDLEQAIRSKSGQRLVALAKSFRNHLPNRDGWKNLDEIVFDLYELDDIDRMLMQDGLFRASWQWKSGWLASSAPASKDDLFEYVRAFLSIMDPWFYTSNKHRMRAEIYDLKPSEPLRVIRFVLEDRPPPSVMGISSSGGSLRDLLFRTGSRLDFSFASALTGAQEFRVTDHSEVVIVKPAARRHWLRGTAMTDARSVLAESGAAG